MQCILANITTNMFLGGYIFEENKTYVRGGERFGGLGKKTLMGHGLFLQKCMF